VCGGDDRFISADALFLETVTIEPLVDPPFYYSAGAFQAENFCNFPGVWRTYLLQQLLSVSLKIYYGRGFLEGIFALFLEPIFSKCLPFPVKWTVVLIKSKASLEETFFAGFTLYAEEDLKGAV
jgi:hypothetical protein